MCCEVVDSLVPQLYTLNLEVPPTCLAGQPAQVQVILLLKHYSTNQNCATLPSIVLTRHSVNDAKAKQW